MKIVGYEALLIILHADAVIASFQKCLETFFSFFFGRRVLVCCGLGSLVVGGYMTGN